MKKTMLHVVTVFQLFLSLLFAANCTVLVRQKSETGTQMTSEVKKIKEKLYSTFDTTCSKEDTYPL